MSGEELPPGWTSASFSEVFGRFQYGYTASASPELPGPRFLRITDLGEDGSGVDWVTVPGCEITPDDFEKYRLRDGDFVFARSGSIEKAWRVEACPEAVFASYLIRARPLDRQLSPFLVQFLRSMDYLAQIGAAGAGIGMVNVNATKLADLQLPVAPLPEQRRIVAKLDELRARSRKAREALDEVPALLDKLKQSVLAAAFRGDLTAEWRAAHPDVEPASVLLDRIRAERRRRWEQANPKKKYVEPEPVDTEGLPELPDGWCWASVGDAFEVFVGATPSRKEPFYWGGNIPWVSSGEVGFCRITSTRECITEEGLRNTSTDVHPPGTVLIGMIGEGRTRGQVAILDIHACNNQNSAAIRVEGTGVLSEFVYRYLESQYERSRSLGSGNNQPALNKSRVQAMVMPIAPLVEQVEMVATLEAAFAAWTDARASRDETSAVLDQLDQSILAKAFRGELVPQDPNDEPAENLLTRIKAEGAGLGPKKARRG